MKEKKININGLRELLLVAFCCGAPSGARF